MIVFRWPICLVKRIAVGALSVSTGSNCTDQQPVRIIASMVGWSVGWTWLLSLDLLFSSGLGLVGLCFLSMRPPSLPDLLSCLASDLPSLVGQPTLATPLKLLCSTGTEASGRPWHSRIASLAKPKAMLVEKGFWVHRLVWRIFHEYQLSYMYFYDLLLSEKGDCG